MKNAGLITIISSILLFGITATADTWECRGSSAGGYRGKCFVTHVKIKNDDDSGYVIATLDTSGSSTTCTAVRVQMGISGEDIGLDNVRAAEALLMTALTTGLPIKFWTANAVSGICDGRYISITKPDQPDQP